MTRYAHVGKYEILEQIGRGGFSAVYKGRDPHIKRLVAIKVCTTEDDTFRRRFFLEAKISGNLQHPNIVTVFDFGLEIDAPFLVEEYLEGEDLGRTIQLARPIGDAQKLEYLKQIARALRYSHRKGVLHRDIKPSNIRAVDDERIKIMDFGIATLKSAHTRLTQVGTLVGSAAYLAPEQLTGGNPDERVDIFSFGVLAYELLTYRRPFAGATLEDVCRQIVKVEPRRLDKEWPDCPDGAAELVHRCLQKDPDDRFQSFDQILPELNDVLVAVRPERRSTRSAPDRVEGSSVQPKANQLDAKPALDATSSRGWRPSRRFAVIALLIGLLTVAGGIAWHRFSSARRVTTAATAATETDSEGSVKAAVARPQGTILVDARPWGEIAHVVDQSGNEVELPGNRVTPLVLELPPGKYDLSLTHPDFEPSSCLVESAVASIDECTIEFTRLEARDYFKIMGWWP